MYKTDYHMHSTFSDGRAAPEDYIAPAVAAGLREIGFSEHLTLFRELEHWNMDPSRIPAYLDHLEQIGKSSNHILIRTGLEVDFFEDKEDEIRSFLSAFQVDYIIGSVHSG